MRPAVRLLGVDFDPNRGPVGETLARFEWGGGAGQSRDVWLPADVFAALTEQLSADEGRAATAHQRAVNALRDRATVSHMWFADAALYLEALGPEPVDG